MKKLIAMTVVATFAIGASSAINGAELQGDSGTTFADLTVGNTLGGLVAEGGIPLTYDDMGGTEGGQFWFSEIVDEAVGVISNGTITVPDVGRPAMWTNSADTEKFLAIDAEKRLCRSILSQEARDSSGLPTVTNTVDIGAGGLFFDSMVQFTAADAVPHPEDGDKLVVWLYGGDADSEDVLGLGEEGKISTNLVVTAGFVDGTSTVVSNYVSGIAGGVSIEPNTWHRLTIKAIKNITQDGETVPQAMVGGFLIFIDGKPVRHAGSKGNFYNLGDLTTSASALGAALFPSLVPAGEAAQTMSCVAFQGNGAVDDISFTTTAPEFAQAAEAETYTLTVTAPNGAFGLFEDYDTTKAISGPSPYVVDLSKEVIYATFVPNDNYVFGGAQLDGVDVEPDIDGGVYYLELDLSGRATANANFELVINTVCNTWPTGDKLDALAGTTVNEAYGITGQVAYVDAKVFTTWAAGNGNVSYPDRTTTTYNATCFLLNIANDADPETIAAQVALAKLAISIQAITFDENGKPVITAPTTWRNGKVVIEGAEVLVPADSDAWGVMDADTDHFFRAKLVLDELPDPDPEP